MGLKNINLTDTYDILKEIKQHAIEKIIFDFTKNIILIELKKDKEGDTEIFCIEPNPLKESQCMFSRGFRGKKGESFLEGEAETINESFKNILISLKPLLSSFSDMKTE